VTEFAANSWVLPTKVAYIAILGVLAAFVVRKLAGLHPLLPLKDRIVVVLPFMLYVAINIVVHEGLGRAAEPLWDWGGLILAYIAMVILVQQRRQCPPSKA